MHLFLPLLASILLVVGLILTKRAGAAGVRPVTTMLLTNVCSAIVFSALWILGGPGQPWWMLWQPAVIALLFILGLMFTLLAVEQGDVSVAMPVFGVKVFFVALLLTVFAGQTLPLSVWVAAVLATAGIGLIQWTGRGHPSRVAWTILLALSAAMSFATFDVLVQAWAPTWGAGRLLPAVYGIVGVVSLAMIPKAEIATVPRRVLWRLALPGALLISLQAICIVATIGVFGDAARVNVVYALRGLWGVALAWLAARIWGGPEAHLRRSVMLTRVVGALLLTAAVIFAITSGD
jgi:drug/metabolite transporter (DMT)-like permease